MPSLPELNAANEDPSKRADAAKELAKKFGAKVLDLYWTIGRYDSAFIVEAPDERPYCVRAELGQARQC